MKVKYYGCSKTGAVRENNEDAILMRAEGDAAFFLVADGIGGGEHGETVSGMLRDRFADWWEKKTWSAQSGESFTGCLEEIKRLLERINHEVVQTYGEHNAGSTVVILFLLGSACAYISSGDSRIYKMRALNCHQVTRDDVYENLPKEWAARYDANSYGKLASAVGIAARLEFSICTDRAHRGDAFFLCSDGVYRYVPQKKLLRLLTLGRCFLSQKRFSKNLSEVIKVNGAGDNYSFVIAAIH